MGQERLISLLLATAHVDKLDLLDIKSIAREFCCKSTRRSEYYGAFLSFSDSFMASESDHNRNEQH